MKRMTVLFLALFMTTGMFAFSVPQIVSSGVDPVTVQPGEAFTLYAEVFDPDGFNDILAVAMFYNDTYLFCLTETDIPGRYEMTFVMPADAPPDTFTLNALAADRNHHISDPYHFSFSISNSKDDSQVSLIAPENSAHFDCSTDITFAWEPYPGTFDAYAFGFFFADGTGIVMPFQNTVTEFTIPGAVWHVLPPGEYFWKVGVFPEIGGPPDAWSDLRSFTVSCHPPSRVFGTIIEIDPDTQTFVLQGRWRNNPEQVIVQVTEETIIHGPDGQPLGFDDLKIQDFALCIGMFENDIFIASHVLVQTPPDPGTVIRGIVTDIFPDQMILTIETFRPDGSIVTVQATEDTVIRGKHGEMPFEDIPIDSFALVKGEWSEDILIADEIFIRHQSPPPMDVVKGIIHEIDAENQILFIGRPDQPDLVPVFITPDTELLGFGGPITFDQIEIGMFARAEGAWEEDHFIAAIVKVRNGEPPPPPDFVEGIIHEIDAENHILFIGPPEQPDSVAVFITPDTELFGIHGPITFDQIEIGMFAMAEGVWEENHFVAFFVHVIPGEPPPPPDFVEGIIHEIDAENHILFIGPPEQPDSVAVFITPDTELLGIHGPITFDQIEIGMFAMAEGVWEENHFVAFVVHVIPGEPPPPPDFVEGIIHEIDAENHILFIGPPEQPDSVAVFITPDTELMGIHGPITFDQIEIGMFAMAEGVWEENHFVAFFVHVMPGEPPPPPDFVEGIIHEIDAENHILFIGPPEQPDSVAVFITPDTELMGIHGPITFDQIEIGMFAMAEGVWEENHFVAFFVHVMPGEPPPPPDFVEGIIHEIDAENHILFIGPPEQPDSVAVFITPDTELFGIHGPITFDQIEIGMFAMAEGVWEENHFVAFVVHVIPGEPPPMDVVKGVIHEIDAENQVLFVGYPDHPDSVAVFITPDTELMGIQGPITFDQIEIGMFARAKGVWEEDHFMAIMVKVLPGEPPPPPM